MSKFLITTGSALSILLASLSPINAAQLIIPDGLNVPLSFKHAVISDQIKLGDSLAMRIDQDVKVGSVTVFKKGDEATSYVEKSKHGRAFGRAGLVEIKSAIVKDTFGNKHNVNLSVNRKGETKSSGIILPVVGALIFLPLMLFGFKKGENVTINPGNVFDAFTVDSSTIEI